MRTHLRQRLETSGIGDLWQRRSEASRERRLLVQQLAEISPEISWFDRLIFFHDTEDEATEKRLKQRVEDLGELIAETTSSIDSFWAELGKELPDVQRARDLEEALQRCLVARQPADIKLAREACQSLVDQALSSLQENLPQDEIEPAEALARIFAKPTDAYLIALASLVSLLEISHSSRESNLEGERHTLLYRPLLVRLVGRTVAAFRQAEPDNLFPMEVISEWLPRDHPAAALPVMPASLAAIHPAGGSEATLREMEDLVQNLAGLDLLLRMTRREISLLHRIIFWSDTPAEARERALKVQRTALCEEISACWQELERHFSSLRRELWPLYAADQTVVVRDAIRAISTTSERSSRPLDCPLLNQDSAVWQTRSFRSQVAHRFGRAWDREELLGSALSAVAALDPPPAPAAHDYVDAARLPELLGPLMEGGLKDRYRQMLEAEAEAESRREKLSSAAEKVSTWDRINVFKESEAEAQEKAMAEGLSSSSQHAIALKAEVAGEFEHLLADLHQPALVGILLGELSRAVEDLRAERVSDTEEYEDNDGEVKTETVYYCVVSGMEQVGEILLRQITFARPKGDTYLPLWAGLEVWSLLDSPYADSLQALSMTELA